MSFTGPPPQFVPNDPLSVALQLRYTDANGVPVDRLYPNDYLSLIGSTVGTQVDQIKAINVILGNYATTLTSLQTQITAIQTSGATAIPQVNAGCLSSPANLTLPVTTVTTYLVSNSCAYNTVLGTPTALSVAVLAENAPVLNTLSAYSQNSAMSGLTGWITLPSTIADSVTNIWLAYTDVRAGVTKALNAVTPTCNQVLVDYQVTLPAFGTGFNLYFSGYTFIPSGFTDTGSTIKIVDAGGNIAINSINIVTQSATNAPYNFQTSGTTLLSGSTYTVYVNSSVANSALGLTCQKTVVHMVTSNSDTSSCCPDIGNYTAQVTSGSTTITLVSNLAYTPRFADWHHKSSGSLTTLPASSSYYMSYFNGGATINLLAPLAATGTVNIDWITYR